MVDVANVGCTIPYALRNEGAAAMGEVELKKLAAKRIEELEAAWGAMLDLYDSVWGNEGETDASFCAAFEKELMRHINTKVSRPRRARPEELVGFAKIDVTD